MEIKNTEFKKILFREKPVIELGLIKLYYSEQGDFIDAIYNYRDDVFDYLSMTKEYLKVKVTDNQLEIIKNYFNNSIKDN
jgi:hypothetical protein